MLSVGHPQCIIYTLKRSNQTKVKGSPRQLYPKPNFINSKVSVKILPIFKQNLIHTCNLNIFSIVK